MGYACMSHISSEYRQGEKGIKDLEILQTSYENASLRAAKNLLFAEGKYNMDEGAITQLYF